MQEVAVGSKQALARQLIELEASKHRIIGLITHNDNGGAQEALARLCRALECKGHQVELWYLYKVSDFRPIDIESQIILNKPANGALDYIRIVLGLRRELSKHCPDAVISFLPLANTVGLLTSWLQRIPIRIASQRNPVQTYSWAMRCLDWYAGTSGLYTHNIANSGDVETSVSGYPLPYRLRTKIIYNGIDAPESSVHRGSARAIFGLKDTEIALVSAGRLARQKNHEFLIQLLGALQDFHLLIAGDGNEAALKAEAVRMGVSDRVQFLGQLDRGKMNELFCAADIFALPSIYEGQSNALLEAMAAGLPIIASDITCHRETLLDGADESGFVIPTTDPNRWIGTLKELARDAHLRRQLSQKALKRVEFFSLERMCSEFEKVVRSEPII